MTVPQTTLTALTSAAHAALEKQAENILAVDVAERIGLTDAFLIASAPSERQVNAIVDEIEDVLREEHDLKPLRREGRAEGRWVLLDFGHFVVHVQHDEERAFYALDRLWKDTPAIDLGLPEESTRPDAATQDDGASASHAS